MKTSMERHYPILVDIGTQFEKNPTEEYVFFYDDGQVYRAFMCDRVDVLEHSVQAIRNGQPIVTVPAETAWRCIQKDNLEFVTGAEMEEVELRNAKLKRDLQKKLIKELGLDKKEEEEVKHEYEHGYNPKLYS